MQSVFVMLNIGNETHPVNKHFNVAQIETVEPEFREDKSPADSWARIKMVSGQSALVIQTTGQVMDLIQRAQDQSHTKISEG